MEYIYKLLDKRTVELLAKKSIISLSRPFCAFKSEGKGFKVFRMMQEEMQKAISLPLLQTNEKLLKETHRWVCGYINSIPPDLKAEYPRIECIKSDLLIAMTIYFQTYCGYFTTLDLCDKSVRTNYSEKNKKLCENKIGFARIPIAENNLDKTYWISKEDEGYCFSCDPQQDRKEAFGCIRGSLHIHDVEYSGPENLKAPYNVFNENGSRRSSSLLKYVDNNYCNQNEKRLMLRIPSYRPNETVLGFPIHYSPEKPCSFDEQMLCTIYGICSEANKYPEYVYLSIDEFDIYDL